MSERVTLYTLLYRFNLDEGECDKAVRKAHIEELSKANFDQWRLLPPPLNVECISVEGIERDIPVEKDRKCSFLYQWKQIKGFAATYRQLINALIAIKSTEDAANVCKVMKRDATVHPYPARHYFRLSRRDDEYKEKSSSSFIASFCADVRMDLKQQLQRSMRELVTQYASFVSRVCSSLIKNHVSPEILSSFLLDIPAFQSDERGRQRGLVLLSDVREQLENAVTIYNVIDTLSVEHASYLNCEIYQSIVGEFGTQMDHDKMNNYFLHRQDYIDRHKLLEYLELHPSRKGIDITNKLFLRLSFDMTMRISQLLDWRASFGAVLGLWGTTFRMYGVEEGTDSVVIIFLVPVAIAKELFPELKLTAQQIIELRALSVLSMRYCDFEFDLTAGSDARGCTGEAATGGTEAAGGEEKPSSSKQGELHELQTQ